MEVYLHEDKLHHKLLFKLCTYVCVANAYCMLIISSLVHNMVLQDLCTPLHYATIHGHSEVLSVLLAANADVNRMSKVSCMVLSLCDRAYEN